MKTIDFNIRSIVIPRLKMHLGITMVIFSVFFIFCLPHLTPAQMLMLSEDKMANVTAQSGLTVVLDTKALVTIDTIGVSDSDSDPANWILLNGFSIDDSQGQGLEISTMDSDPFVFDVGTTVDGRTILQFNLTPFANGFSMHVEDIDFCNEHLGRMDINNIELSPSSLLRFSHHLGNSTGVEFDAAFGLDIESFQYTYNTLDESLSFSGIHIAQSFSGAPEYPLHWESSGDFKIGNLDTLPASIDVGTSNAGQTAMVLSLPVSGSIRIEDLSLDNRSFGPVVIDNIMAHRLTVELGP